MSLGEECTVWVPNGPARKPTGSPPGSLPPGPANVDTLVSSAWTQPSRAHLVGCLAAGSGDAGRDRGGAPQSFLQDSSELLPAELHFVEEETEAPSSLTAGIPEEAPAGLGAVLGPLQLLLPTPRRQLLPRPEAHSQGLHQPLPKSVLSLAFSFLPVPGD